MLNFDRNMSNHAVSQFSVITCILDYATITTDLKVKGPPPHDIKEATHKFFSFVQK